MADKRHLDGRYPVASRAFAAQTFPATASDALAATLANINGIIEAIEIVISDTEDAISYTVAIASATDATIYSEAGLEDNQTHYKKSLSNKAVPDADFNPALVNGTLTATITPSAAPDAGEVGNKTATVQVIIYYR